MADFTPDHDLLIELRTEMRGMRDDIKDLKDTTASRLSSLEKKTTDLEEGKASKDELDRTNIRMDRVRTTQNIMVGGLIVVNTLIPFIIKYLFK